MSLLSFRQYAERAGINVSSVSRAVARGYIPTVNRDGQRLIDADAADRARERRFDPHGPGGTPERREEAKARWRARTGQGFDYGQLLLLAVLWEHGPALMAETMRMDGAESEMDIARAAAAFHEIVDVAAIVLFDEFNRSGVGDYRRLLPKVVLPDLSAEGLDHYQFVIGDDDSDESPVWAQDFHDRAAPLLERASVVSKIRRRV
ncbi:hypothetical protein [Antarcticirhabdus aurantiaca]|uniref:Uncharacterized protein n=1 Tax=Antarcticirhabdus aurantiaca TaxID=2606717 RepID=A0ACD4NUQ5_9HYPH|nr:hypothetical protein [Antarcticirhabdus aurantiaca]WAJ30615.1 hypothetical protein OXU80_10585 [Jeongeuplla avenae]